MVSDAGVAILRLRIECGRVWAWSRRWCRL